jgi:TRAP-type C4-dicarboxylate transport system substrate-binding protein
MLDRFSRAVLLAAGADEATADAATRAMQHDIIEQIHQGANIGQNTDAARLGNYVRGIAAVNALYFVTTLDKAFALADAATMIAWQKELVDKHRLKAVCFDWVQGFRHFFTNKPVHKPEDLKGQRIRTPRPKPRCGKRSANKTIVGCADGGGHRR